MAMNVTVRRSFTIRGVPYDRNQVVDLETWPVIGQVGAAHAARLARQFAEQNYFMNSSVVVAMATRGIRSPGVVSGVGDAGAELEVLREVLDAKDTSLRGQLDVDHRGHKATVEACQSPRCAWLRAVLAIGVEPATETRVTAAA